MFSGRGKARSADPQHVKDLEAQIAAADTLLLALAPEGTRRYVDYWKSGFLRLARATGMPVGLAYIDYARRTVGVAGYLTLSGDDEADMAEIARAYAGVVARNPANVGRIRLRESSGPTAPPPRA